MSARRQPRNIVAEWHWKESGDWQVWKSRYARLDTAIPKIVQFALLRVFPGGVVSVYHAVTGLEIGTVRVGVGKVTCNWLWDKGELGGN